MRRKFLGMLLAALFAALVVGCGGTPDNGDNNGTVDQNAPAKKLDPTILHPEFD